jgi:hypothetical protein
LTGISKIIGVLEVTSDGYVDESPLWEDAVFLIRLKVKLKSKQMGGDKMKRRAISRSASGI